MAEWEGWAPVTVDVHLYPATVLTATLHPDPDRPRVVLHVRGTNSVDVNVFVERAELARLRDAVTAACVDLDAATDTATPIPDDDHAYGDSATATAA